MRKFNMGKIYRACSLVALCAFCVLMTNCTLFGTGNFLYPFGISVIGISVVAMGLFSIPVLLVDFKKIIKNATLWVLVVFAAWNAVAAVVGFRNGNKTEAIMADINGVIYFVLFPVILGVLNSRKRVHVLMKCMIAASCVQSLLACLLLWSYVSDGAFFTKLLTYCNYGHFINFTNISATIPRILFVSAPFQLCGCAFSLYFIVREKRVAVQYVTPLALGLFTILLTYTRALYLGAFVTALLLVILYLIYERKPAQQKEFWFGILTGIIIFTVLVCGFSLNAKTNYLAYGLNRVFSGVTAESPSISTDPTPGDVTVPDETKTPPAEYLPGEDGSYTEDTYINATVQSDMFRAEMKKDLLEMIRQAPITGHGLGAVLPSGRVNAEYSFLDLGAKKGVVGLILYLLPMLLMIFCLAKDIFARKKLLLSGVWLSVLLGFFMFSVFQPYLNNAPCMLMYCCALCVRYAEEKEVAEEKDPDASQAND